MNKHVGDAELDAYADGEVEEARRQGIREHVMGCEPCRDKVEAVGAMRAALARHWNTQAAPSDLRSRAMAAMLEAARGDDALGRRSDDPFSARGDGFAGRDAAPARRRVVLERPWVRRALAATTLAAAVVAAVTWWRPTDGDTAAQKLVVVVPDRAVLGVREAHVAWERESGATDRRAVLASSPSALAEQLSRALELDVAVPDFSAAGFALVGGGLCDVSGLPAAHIKYLRERPVSILSFFTTLRNERMSSSVGDQKGGREFFVSRDDSQSADPTVVAWHSGQQTYVVCAHLPRQDLIAIVTASRIAVAPPLAEPGLLAAAEFQAQAPRNEALAVATARADAREAVASTSSSTPRANRGGCLVKVGLAFWAISQLQ